MNLVTRVFAHSLVAVLATASSADAVPQQAVAPVSAPTPPDRFTVVPNYAIPGSMIVKWRDKSNDERGFKILRSVNGEPYGTLASLPQNSQSYTDFAVNSNDEYEYKMLAFNAAGESAPTVPVRQNLKTTWLVPGSHELMTGWNECIGEHAIIKVGHEAPPPIGFHNGVDIQRSIPGFAEPVVAARGGMVVDLNNGPNGSVRILVQTGLTSFEVDRYNHLEDVQLHFFESVFSGQEIASIDSSTAFSPCKQHTHFLISEPTLATLVNDKHPLSIFHLESDLDPHLSPPALVDHPGSPPGVMLFRELADPSGGYLPFEPGEPSLTPLFGDISILAEVADGAGSDPDLIPAALGYWIESLGTAGGCTMGSDVRSPSTAYRLFNFAEQYFGANESSLEFMGKIVDDSLDYGATLPCTSSGQPLFINFKHFIVTNTKGSDGSKANVSADEFWNTDAKDDGSSATDAEANFASKPDANTAGEARFADGLYRIHVLASDLVHHDVDLTQDVRVENFPPVVCHADPTGELPPDTTSVTCSVVFSEAMDVTVDPLSAVEVDSGSIIGSAIWADDRTLTFEVLGLVQGSTYTVTVGHVVTDLPGKPGGNELDGNKDGVAGDDFQFSFATAETSVVLSGQISSHLDCIDPTDPFQSHIIMDVSVSVTIVDNEIASVSGSFELVQDDPLLGCTQTVQAVITDGGLELGPSLPQVSLSLLGSGTHSGVGCESIGQFSGFLTKLTGTATIVNGTVVAIDFTAGDSSPGCEFVQSGIVQ